MLKFVSTINMNQIQNKGQMSAKSFFPLQEDETYYDKNTWNQSNVCKTKQKTKWKKLLLHVLMMWYMIYTLLQPKQWLSSSLLVHCNSLLLGRHCNSPTGASLSHRKWMKSYSFALTLTCNHGKKYTNFFFIKPEHEFLNLFLREIINLVRSRV